jgi:5,10-methylenetetrahydromethanopterin reductase
MSSMAPEIGLCFERTLAPGLVVEAARRLEAGGADRLWLIEDCFYTAGVSLAAAALAVTDRLGVGIGILPAVARNPAITAMELATLCGLGPGRVLPGIGHGVQSWMGQIGARPASPVTALEEVLVAVRRLLGGERVTMHGHHVVLEDVELDQPPADPPPVLAGVRGPRSLAMAGQAAGGIVLAEPASPTFVRLALDRAGRPPGFHVAVFAALCVAADRDEAQRRAAPWLAGSLDDPAPEIRALPFFDDMAALHAARGTEGLATMPADWWAEIGPVGTLDDAVAHLEALGLAGVRSVGLLPIPRAEDLGPIHQVLAVARAVDRA